MEQGTSPLDVVLHQQVGHQGQRLPCVFERMFAAGCKCRASCDTAHSASAAQPHVTCHNHTSHALVWVAVVLSLIITKGPQFTAPPAASRARVGP